MTARRAQLAAVFALAGALLAAALVLKHYGVGTPADAVCGEGQASGCDVVNQSQYASLAGVPLAAIGLVFYGTLCAGLALASLAGDAARAGFARLALLALSVSLLVDLGLLGIQAFSLHAYCALCLLSYAAGVGAFVALLPAWRAPAAGAASTERRLLSAGTLAAALALGVTVAIYQAALGGRKPEAGPILGAAAQKEVQRLQAILDDPQKLEQYFSDKAQREYEQSPVLSLDLAGVPFKGPADAPVKVVEYSDFLCPFCRSLANGFASYLQESGGRVAVYFKNYPLDTTCNTEVKQQVHHGSCLLSLAALCASDQGRFWQYHDAIFGRELQKPLSRDELLPLATKAGLDAGALSACIDKPATLSRLQDQIREGARGGVKGTPTVFINGKRVSRLNDFVAIVNKETARLGLPPLAPPGSAGAR